MGEGRWETPRVMGKGRESEVQGFISLFLWLHLSFLEKMTSHRNGLEEPLEGQLQDNRMHS